MADVDLDNVLFSNFAEKDFVPKKPINEESIAVAESKEIKPVPAPGAKPNYTCYFFNF